jgi:RNA polymerase sigma factor (sigma-70 family)
LTDQELIQGFLTGSKHEYAQISEWIAISVRLNSRDSRIDQDDVIADTRLKLLLNFEKGSFRHNSSLKTYVQRVAYKTLVDAIRRQRRVFPLDENAGPADPSNPHSQLEERELLRLVDRGMDILPDNCQKLLEMVLGTTMSTRDIADRLGVTEGAAKTRLSRCRKELIAIVRGLM